MKALLLVHQIDRCLIDSHRVVRGQNSDVRHYVGIGKSQAVTSRGDVHQESEEKYRPFLFYHPIGMFADLLLKVLGRFVPLDIDRSAGADSNALATAKADNRVNDGELPLVIFPLLKPNGICRTVLTAGPAAGAFLPLDKWNNGGMHRQLA
ncbi:MAG: hypothetical protein DDT28_00820 [Dehalococcoidia bacterium]|nr:hypothetical protein [Chloroflexota bacterium]